MLVLGTFEHLLLAYAETVAVIDFTFFFNASAPSLGIFLFVGFIIIFLFHLMSVLAFYYVRHACSNHIKI